LVAVLPDGQYVAALGGLFPEAELLRKALPILPAGHRCALAGARLKCELSGGVAWFEQASDGVLVASNSEQALNAALAAGEHGVTLGLQRAPITLVVKWQHALSKLPVNLATLGMPEWVSELTGVAAEADLGDPLQVQATLSGVGTPRLNAVRESLQQVQLMAGLVPGPDVAGERDLLARATVDTAADGFVRLRSQWERKDLERAARAFADWFENVLLS
jgi:hypothetical protein